MQVAEPLVGDEHDLRTFLAKPPFYDGYVRVFCPSHEDHNRPSAALYEQNLYCYTCGTWIGRLPTLALIREGKLQASGVVGGGAHNAKARYLPISLAEGYHQMLMTRHQGRIQWLLDRGITLDAIRRFNLGHTGRAFTIPVFSTAARSESDGSRASEALSLSALKFRLDPAKDLCPDSCTCDKYWGTAGSNSGVLYDPLGVLSARGAMGSDGRVSSVVLTEGELDAVVLAQHGIAAASSISGSNSGVLYDPLSVRSVGDRGPRLVLTEGELDAVVLAQAGIPAVSSISGSQDTKCLEGLQGADITLCYDQDDAGVAGAEKVRAFLRERGNTVRTVRWRTEKRNGKAWPKDVTDFVRAYGIDVMRERLRDAR